MATVHGFIYLWRIHFDIWQNQYNYVKFKNKIKLQKKKESNTIEELSTHAHPTMSPMPVSVLFQRVFAFLSPSALNFIT